MGIFKKEQGSKQQYDPCPEEKVPQPCAAGMLHAKGKTVGDSRRKQEQCGVSDIHAHVKVVTGPDQEQITVSDGTEPV
jgi:hypothetical protein